MVNFVRRFIKDYADVTVPLLVLLPGKIVWAEQLFQNKAWNSEQDHACTPKTRIATAVGLP